MKTLPCTILAAAILALGANFSRADNGYSFAISNELKKVGGETKQVNNEIKTKEEWAYKVTIENKSFKDAENIEVKYVIFMKPDVAGERMIGKQKLKRKAGGQTIPLIKNFDTFTFVTEAMTLTGTQLQAGWIYGNGANPRAKDALNGFWIRVFVGGQQVTEYINPPSLKSRETWEGGGK